jgi:hypothetical protein
MEALIKGLRKETGVPGLPFVFGSYREKGIPDDLSDFDPSQVKSARRVHAGYVLKAQWDAQALLKPAKAVILRDLERHPENVHANTNGILELGRLLAEGYLELVQVR